MTDTLTISGLVATTPRHLITAEGYSITSFRLASNLRKFDRKKNAWVDAGTNWYSVSTYRQLASNVIGSVQKGDRVLVTGRLRISEWGDGDKHGVNIDLDADALGHDLRWGTAAFTRTIRAEPVDAEGTEAESRDAETATAEGDPSDTFTDSAGDEARDLEPATPF
ncbi:MAG: single-stranded DNA-binding protein [Cryobacterium sp.]|nr:single-stranded DNA-binding protein [Cryobacterium sp.]